MITFNSDIPQFSFCPNDLYIGEGDIVISPTIFKLQFICIFPCTNMLLVKLSAPEFGACTFRIVMIS